MVENKRGTGGKGVYPPTYGCHTARMVLRGENWRQCVLGRSITVTVFHESVSNTVTLADMSHINDVNLETTPSDIHSYRF